MLVEIEYPDLFKDMTKEEIAELCMYAFDQLTYPLQCKVFNYARKEIDNNGFA